jgi:predicted dehydrogenase
MSKSLNVALVGQKFMGRTHSNAWLKVAKFFDLPLTPVMHTIVAQHDTGLAPFAARWGWQHQTTHFKEVLKDPEIELVDLATPNHVHAELALAALAAGKHVACEKPLAGTLKDARRMMEAARKAKNQKTFVWYNYRRCPAVALAHQLVKQGALGRIYHVRAQYLQGWADPNVPLIWRFQKKYAGSGSNGDLNAHIIDMARFVTGDEISEVSGAIAETFVKERRIPSAGPAGGIAGGTRGGSKKGKVDVDDAVLFLARFTGGAVGSFEATRFAKPNQNAANLEVNGEKGAIKFEFENMNVLWFHDATADPKVTGWTRVMCTSAANHPYAAAWWPDAHVLGYEHGFINQAADIVRVLGHKKPEVPLPDFADAYQTQRVLEAALLSAKNRCAVKMSEVR